MTDRTRVGLFFLCTFALSWACQAPAIVVLRQGLEPPALVMAMMAVGCAGPSLTALWLGALARRRAPERPRTEVTPTRLWSLSLIALLLPAGAHLVGSVLLALVGQYTARHVLYPPLRPEQLVIAVLAPLGEEYGFRGYALPRLQASMSPLRASLCIGVGWAVWHVPTFFVPGARGVSPLEIGLYLLAFVASSVVYTWLYNAGGGRMRGPLLAHLGIHLDNVFRASTMGDGVRPLASTALVLTLFACGLVVSGALASAARPRGARLAQAGRAVPGTRL